MMKNKRVLQPEMWIFETIGIWDPGCKGIFSGGNGMEDPSYVISVSTGRGCYRHIQIPGNWTLFQLHQEILSAFEFDDDQPHAFLWIISHGVRGTVIIHPSWTEKICAIPM